MPKTVASMDHWLIRYEEHLLSSGLISTSITKSNREPLDSYRRLRSWLIIFVAFVVGAVRSVIILSSFVVENETTKRLLYTIGGDVFHGLGFASIHINGEALGACLMSPMDRWCALWAEKKRMLHQLYLFYPANEVSPKKLGLSNEGFQSMKTAVKMLVRLLDLVYYCSIIPFMILLVGICILTNIQENSVVFAVVSIPHLLNQMTLSYFGILTVAHSQGLIFLSTKFLTLKLKDIKGSAEKCTHIRSILRETNNLFIAIQNHNFLIRYLLRDTMILLCPMFSLVMFVAASDVPSWFLVLLVLAAIPVVSLTQASLYFSGRLHVQSRRLAQLLSSAQLAVWKKGKVPYQSLLQLNRLIKLVSSERQPFSFTLPDGTPFTPITSVSFMSATISNTFLCLNNSLLK